MERYKRARSFEFSSILILTRSNSSEKINNTNTLGGLKWHREKKEDQEEDDEDRVYCEIYKNVIIYNEIVFLFIFVVNYSTKQNKRLQERIKASAEPTEMNEN